MSYLSTLEISFLDIKVKLIFLFLIRNSFLIFLSTIVLIYANKKYKKLLQTQNGIL